MGEVEWLRPAHAARRLGVDRSTVHRWADTYSLRGKRMPSGERRYHAGDVSALAAWIEDGKPIADWVPPARQAGDAVEGGS